MGMQLELAMISDQGFADLQERARELVSADLDKDQRDEAIDQVYEKLIFPASTRGSR